MTYRFINKYKGDYIEKNIFCDWFGDCPFYYRVQPKKRL